MTEVRGMSTESPELRSNWPEARWDIIIGATQSKRDGRLRVGYERENFFIHFECLLLDTTEFILSMLQVLKMFDIPVRHLFAFTAPRIDALELPQKWI